MGKTTAARLFRRLRVPVHDADATVHRLMAPGGPAFAPIAAAFPAAIIGGRVDRVRLGAEVFAQPDRLRQLEAILHPLVHRAEAQFLARCRRRREPLVVLDIPLLFETGGQDRCDAVATVSAPARIQRQRVLRRPGMSEARLDAILARQMPDADKRRRARYVIPTGLGLALTARHIRHICRQLRGWA